MSEHTHRILIIDDQAAIHEDYRKILGEQPSTSSVQALDKAAADLFGDDPATFVEWEGFELDSAYQGQEGLELVQRSIAERRPYSVAFVDIRMPPGWDGIETIRHIWEVDPEILVVICSAYSDYSWQEMVRELGRNDRYLILKKPFDNIEVRQCAMALSERWSVSRTDVLTGLLNRRAFRSYLDLEWARSARHQFSLACAMLDLDYFKRVNDTVGHPAGDVVLKNVARMLQMKCRASDFVCRYGGEEICVLLTHTNEQAATTWAENARRDIEALRVAIGDRSVAVTASIGVAERLAEDDSTQRLIERADQALMRAKAIGRNRVVSFSTMTPTLALPGKCGCRVNPWAGVTLGDVMSAPVVSLKAAIPVREATQILLQFGISSMPVVDPDGALVGVLSESDLLTCLASPDTWSMPIDGIMRREVVSYQEDTPLQSICEFLSCAAVERVFIVRDGRPIGVVTRGRLLRCCGTALGSRGDANFADALTLSGEVNAAQLMEGARALAQYAAQLSAALSGQTEDSALSVVADVGKLQRFIDDLLACSREGRAPAIVSAIPDTQTFGSPSGPMVPLG
jgi:diguanylate cyclase (GGDEF)-like protein